MATSPQLTVEDSETCFASDMCENMYKYRDDHDVTYCSLLLLNSARKYGTMMFNSLKPHAAPARFTVARSSQRVFSDAEWDAATKTASRLLQASEVAVEQATSETSFSDATPPPAGRTFSDAQWDQALKDAPMLLKTLQDIEEGAASGESASAETASIPASSGVNAEGSVFTPEQWDAAIKAAVAIQKAEEAEQVCS